MKAVLLTLGYLLYCEGAVLLQKADKVINNRPIIGVLSQETSSFLHTQFPQENYTSYLVASYVKDVESSGARVVPIMIGKDRSYYKNILSKVNGVLWPGGAASFKKANGYADAAQHIYEIAQELNDQGDYFPIFGTCLGFEYFIILASGRGEKENRIICFSFDTETLDFTDDYRSSRMFKEAPEEVIRLLSTEDITVNAHAYCIVDENLRAYNLTGDWHVTSYSNDMLGVKFIASIEHRRYPFYGVQFHPEKPAFEWKSSPVFLPRYPHSAGAVKANRYFMDFFVDECRKNTHSFANKNEENKYLIYNYRPSFTGTLGSAFQQSYLLEPRGKVRE